MSDLIDRLNDIADNILDGTPEAASVREAVAKIVAVEARRDDWESAHQAMVERNAYLEAELARLSAPVTDAEVAEVLALDDAAAEGQPVRDIASLERAAPRMAGVIRRLWAQQATVQKDAERYRFWRLHIQAAIDDEDGILGLGFSFLLPLQQLKTLSMPELADAIADAATKSKTYLGELGVVEVTEP